MDLTSTIRPKCMISPAKYSLCFYFNSYTGGLEESGFCFVAFGSIFCMHWSKMTLYGCRHKKGDPTKLPCTWIRSGCCTDCGNAGLCLWTWSAAGTASSRPKIRSLPDHQRTSAAFMSASCKCSLQTLYVTSVLQLIALESNYSVREAAVWSLGLRPQMEDMHPATRRKISRGPFCCATFNKHAALFRAFKRKQHSSSCHPVKNVHLQSHLVLHMIGSILLNCCK